MGTINLIEQRAQIVALATSLFDKITKLPKDRRPDDKERTGIQIYLREVGTRNSIFASIYQPSEQAQSFAVEKAVRSETIGDYSSQNSEDPDKMKFRGSVTVYWYGGRKFQASTSGLQGDEDVVISTSLLSLVLGIPIRRVRQNITDRHGKLPSCFTDRDHYLFEILGL